MLSPFSSVSHFVTKHTAGRAVPRHDAGTGDQVGEVGLEEKRMAAIKQA